MRREDPNPNPTQSWERDRDGLDSRAAESGGPLVSGMRENKASLVGGDREQTEEKLPAGKRGLRKAV